MQLVFVCWGNICRSPMAERVARRKAEERGLDVDIVSFGLSDEEQGKPIDRRAVAVLQEAGYDTQGHQARRITADDVAHADMVVVAEPYMVQRLREVSPGADNLRLLNDFNPTVAPGTALQDPWYGDDEDFHATLAHIEAAVPGILDEMAARS